MVEESSVRRFCDEVGVGKVYGPYANGSEARDGYPRRPFWMWVAELDAADLAVERLVPHLSEWRRAAIAELFPDVLAALVA